MRTIEELIGLVREPLSLTLTHYSNLWEATIRGFPFGTRDLWGREDNPSMNERVVDSDLRTAIEGVLTETHLLKE